MAWFSPNWTYRKKITIDNTDVPATQSNYLCRVKLIDADITGKSRADGFDIAFTSSDETTQLDHVLEKRQFLNQGAWSWFSRPRSVYHSNANEKTYTGYVNSSGDVIAAEYNHKTGAYTETTLHAALDNDDHANPSIVVLPDHKLLYFYTAHSGTSIYYRKSTSAESIAAFDTEGTISPSGGSVTYAQPHLLTGDGNRVVVFYRSVDDWGYTVASSPYTTWSTPTDFFVPNAAGEEPYILSCTSTSTRIDICASGDHPCNAGLTDSGVFHAYSTWSSGTPSWFQSDGTSITPDPFDRTDMTEVETHTSEYHWVWDIRVNGSGYPELLTTNMVTTTNHDYYHNEYNGSTWSSTKIADAGTYLYSAEPCYSGGMCFGKSVDEIYCSINATSTVFELQRWTESGGTWSKAADITTGSRADAPNFRPECPLNQPSGKRFEVLWCSGQYTAFDNFDETDIYCYPALNNYAVVKIPSVSSSVDTDIYIYYGYASATDQQDAVNCFSDCHFYYTLEKLPGMGGYDDMAGNYDATFNANNWPINHYDSTLDMVGWRADTQGTAALTQIASGFELSGDTQLALEAIIYVNNNASTYENEILSNWTGTNQAFLWRVDNSPAGDLNCFAYLQTDTQVGGATSLTIASTTNTHVGYALDSTDMRGYKNGAEGATTYSTSAAFDANTNSQARIGSSEHDTNEDMAGRIYALAAYKTNKSSGWYTTRYNNLMDLSNFYTLGSETQDTGKTITSSLDARLQKTLSITTGFDALLQKAAIITASLDSLLSQAKTISGSIDSLLQAGQVSTSSLDSLVQKAVSVATSLDARVQDAFSITASIDSILTSAGTSTITTSVDGLLQDTLTVTSSLDARLQDAFIVTASLDAVLVKAYTVVTGVDAYLQKTLNISFGADSLLQKTASVSAGLDSSIMKALTIVSSVDAFIAGAHKTITAGINAAIMKAITASALVDAVLTSSADTVYKISMSSSARSTGMTGSSRSISIT